MDKLFLVLLALIMPLLGVQIIHHPSISSLIIHLGVASGLWLLLVTSQKLGGRAKTFGKFLLIGFYFIYLFIALFESILFDFTGKGFNNEVYFHIEPESLRIAFTQYPVELFGFLILVIGYIWVLNLWLKDSKKSIRKWLQFSAVFVLCTLVTVSPMGRFTKGLYEYSKNESEIDQSLIQPYIDLNIINSTAITPKLLLHTEATNPKNLILLYLESFNKALTEQTEYPELTPNLINLGSEFQTIDHLNSAYVTIEGIIASQCGTVLPMTAGNNTFLNSGQLMSMMPCMGDILKHAGYSQYYLGGAAMEFAGKGRFLEEHGYDHIWGSEYWFTNGFKRHSGGWGLSDTELFENALTTIKTAAKSPPYNVTLLTLGTHIPGYTYTGCQPYQHSDEPFINAIHCTDQLVGNFVNRLKMAGLLDDTILMIVADHGVFKTKKMKELFGGMAQDRRLIAITNYPNPMPKSPIATYDIAPTLLDMLGIKHNAVFLYGHSLLNKLKKNQRHVTRYADWQDLKPINNQAANCNDSSHISWPLNRCNKNQLMKLTSQILEWFSIDEPTEALDCKIYIAANSIDTKDDVSQQILTINEKNHFEHFYHNGYMLDSLKIKSGHFVFELNADLDIIKHWYFKNDDSGFASQQTLLENSSSSFLKLTLVNSENEHNAKAKPNLLRTEFHQNKFLTWSMDSQKPPVSSLNLCANNKI